MHTPSERKRARWIGMLRRRAAHLQRRIETAAGKRLSFDEAELKALLWAIAELEALHQPKGGAA